MFKCLKRLKFIFKFKRSFPFLKDFFLSREVKLYKKVLGVSMLVAYAYFPFDLIPDFLYIFGIIDDVVIATFVLERMIRIAPPVLKEKYKVLE